MTLPLSPSLSLSMTLPLSMTLALSLTQIGFMKAERMEKEARHAEMLANKVQNTLALAMSLC